MKFPKPKKQKKKHISKKIDNYEDLWQYVFNIYGWQCQIAHSKGEYAPPDQLHHKLHKSLKNMKRFPFFIDSIFNLIPVNHDWHEKYRNWGKTKVFQADKIERYIIDNRECLEIGYFKSKEELEKCIKDILNDRNIYM